MVYLSCRKRTVNNDYITGRTFFKVLDATQSLAIKSDSPQIALVLGHFIFIYQAHWNNVVSCLAKRRQILRQLNLPSLIPCMEDVVILKTWLTRELET